MFLITERVQAGVELLDSQVPGWDSRIDLDTLDICSESSCVIGQLFGRYDKGLNALDLWGVRAPYELGFSRRLGEGGVDEVFDLLTRQWRKVIEQRRVDA